MLHSNPSAARFAGLAVVLFLMACLNSSTAAQTTTLNSSENVERTIAPLQKQFYRIKLQRGKFCRVSVTQQPGVDLILTLYSSQRTKVAKVGGYRGYLKMTGRFPLAATFGEIKLSFISDHEGVYQIEVNAEQTQISGSYQIKIDVLEWAIKADFQRVEAERLFERGERLRFPARNKEELQLAITYYKRALNMFQNISDDRNVPETLDALGLTYQVLQNVEKALESFNSALDICRAQRNLPCASVLLRHLSGTHTGQLKLKEALSEADEELRIWRSLGDKLNEARSFYTQLGVRVKMSVTAEAQLQVLDLFKQNVRMFHELGSVAEEAYLLSELASYYTHVGEPQVALDMFRKALSLAQPIGYQRYCAVPLLRIGEIFYEHGDFQKAFDYYSEALMNSRNTDSYNEAYALYNLGVAALALGDNRAFEYFTQALPIWEGNRNGEAYTLSGLGRFYSSQNQLEKAVNYYNRALPIMRDTGDTFGVAIILSDTGAVYAAMGDRTRATAYYDQALEAHRKVNDRRDEARTLIRVGELHETSGGFGKALTCYQSALQLFREIGNDSGQAETYYFLARAELGRSNLETAELNIKQSLRIIEHLRAGIFGEELRTSYFASVQLYYEFYIDLLMTFHQRYPDKGFDQRALQAKEDSRARTLLELLIESRADIRKGVEPALLQRERDVRQRLDATASRQVKLKTEAYSEVEAKKLEEEIEQLLDEFKIIEGRIRVASPHYANITQAVPPSLNQLKSVLDENTVLLEYSLGQTRSFLWFVAQKDLKVFVLPGRSEIERLSRRVFEILTAAPPQTTDVRSQSFLEAANELSRMVLSPVLPLTDGKRLLVVTDGALQYIPFAALPVTSAVEARNGSKEISQTKYRPLIQDHEIVNLPSAGTLLILRSRPTSRRIPEKAVAILADPVFSSSDYRINNRFRNSKRSDSAEFSTNSRIQRALRETGFNETPSGIPRLPFSRYEANAIAELVPKEQALELLDFNANRMALMDPQFARYRIIHIATHALLNSQHPELSGVLFSLVDERGHSQNGFLQLHEIYNLDLPADLVVLSACQTALGREIRGEGLIGLTRGFMYAGANRVLATLWKVDDEATAEIMRLFYTAMLKNKQSPSTALRTAQMKMQQTKPWTAPYYWSGFTLQGEWR